MKIIKHRKKELVDSNFNFRSGKSPAGTRRRQRVASIWNFWTDCFTWRWSHLLDCSKNPTKVLCAGGPPQHAGHDLIPTPGLEGWTDRKSVCLDTGSSRDKHDSPARTWSHPRRRRDTPARPRTPARPKTTTTVLCWDS